MRSALVVGASRGLGLGLAEELERRGWRVTGTVRDPANAVGLEECGAAVEHVDIADAGAVAALARRLREHRFDLLFINAGVSGPQHQRAEHATAEEIADSFGTNALAPITAARILLDSVAEGGIVAFMSSILGSVTLNTDGSKELYRASKAALNSLSRGFAAEVRNRGITVLNFHPGWVRTDMGGSAAPLDVATSVRGLAEVLDSRRGSRTHAFLDYQGHELPW